MNPAESAQEWAMAFAMGMNLMGLFAAPLCFSHIPPTEDFKSEALAICKRMEWFLKQPIQPEEPITCPSLPAFNQLLSAWAPGETPSAELITVARRGVEELGVPTPEEGWDNYAPPQMQTR